MSWKSISSNSEHFHNLQQTKDELNLNHRPPPSSPFYSGQEKRPQTNLTLHFQGSPIFPHINIPAIHCRPSALILASTAAWDLQGKGECHTQSTAKMSGWLFSNASSPFLKSRTHNIPRNWQFKDLSVSNSYQTKFLLKRVSQPLNP